MKKKALLIAMDDYKEYASFEGAVKLDAMELRKVLNDPLLGQFDAEISENSPVDGLRSKVQDFFQSARRNDQLLFYFSGHAEQLSGEQLVFLPRDASPHASLETFFPDHELIELIRETEATKISVILDCCHSTTFNHALDRCVYNGGFSKAGSPGKSVQILMSPADAKVSQQHSTFTYAILNAIRSGIAANRRPSITLADMAEYLTVSRQLKPEAGMHFRTFQPDTVVQPVTHHLSLNPHAGQSAPGDLVRNLHSDDEKLVTKAIRKLQATISAEATSFSAKNAAETTLINFARQYEGKSPAILAILAPYLNLTEKRASRSDTEVHIFFHTRNRPFADAAYRYFRHLGAEARLIDLEYPLSLSQNDILEIITMGRFALWICDAAFARTMNRRYPDIARCLGETSFRLCANRATYWLEQALPIPTDSPLCRAGLTDTIRQPIEAICLGLAKHANPALKAPTDYVPELHDQTGVERGESEFFELLQHHDAKLKKHREVQHFQPLPLNPREPKFLIFRRGEEFVMAILDTNADVNPSCLQYTFEPQVRARLASAVELDALGFKPGRVDPMWFDPAGHIKRIFVDANLFFQFLMFPLSRVILPNYRAGDDVKVTSSMSAFIRSLQQFHGDQKVIFANITTQKTFSDQLLTGLLSHHHTFSRFAPTPSNSLHIGSLRTALISYLFSITHPELGRFHIRFDDTNVEAEAARVNSEEILKDLQWIGLPRTLEKHKYRQTDKQAQKQYETALDLLEQSQLVREKPDGSVELKPDNSLVASAYWLDLRRGPQVMHSMPRLSSNKQTLDYSLTRFDEKTEKMAFKYKFAGAVDDMVHNSLVVRDIRQDHSFFTLRQSIIMAMFREALAFPRNSRAKAAGKNLRQSEKQRIVNHSQFRPFPFTCPPIYFHVSRVIDAEGKNLSKRSLRAEHTISHLRRSGTYFPETILAWCLFSLGRRFCATLGFHSLQDIAVAIARIGVRPFLHTLEGRVQPEVLWKSEQGHSIRISSLPQIDFLVLRNIPPFRLQTFTREVLEEQIDGHTIEPVKDTDEILLRIGQRRTAFSGAEELSRFVGHVVMARLTPPPSDLFVPSALEFPPASAITDWLDDLRGTDPKILAWIRFCLTGVEQGPAIKDLLFILGAHRFLATLRDWRRRYV